MNFKNNKAFSFAELSIILLIVGSFFAIVHAGKSILEQAENRNIINNIYNYEIVIDQFYEKFTKYPGDFNQAYNFFSTDCAASAVYCNGDGDGFIESSASSDYERENLRIWQHLNLAELLAGNYSGTGGNANLSNSPLGELDNSIYYIDNNAIFSDINNKILLSSVIDTIEYKGVISVLSAKSIDSKIDDSIANKGRIYAVTGDNLSNSSDCTAYRTSLNGADYNLSSTEKQACVISYLFDKD